MVDNKDNENLPFQKEWAPPEKQRKGLKIDNKRSVVDQSAQHKASFEEMAEEFMVERIERNKKALELARQFMDMMRDKTLEDNKSPLANDFEKELCGRLVNLALVANQDEQEPEGYGSVAIINLLLKAIIFQRNHINSLEYRLSRIEKMSSGSHKAT